MSLWRNLRTTNKDEQALSELCIRILEEEFKFSKPTPIQSSVIPLFLSNRDVLAQAATGSGKTLSFLIPLFELLQRQRDSGNVLKSNEVGGIVISPTRELALQTYQVAQRLQQDYGDLSMLLLIGGSGHEVDEAALKQAGGANVIIGTPGRIEAALVQNKIDVSVKHLEMLCLDEADRLLDMGFEKSLNNILQVLPKQRRTGLFSATLSSDLKSLAKAGLRNPATIEVKVKGKAVNAATQSTPNTLSNFYCISEYDEKLTVLFEFLKTHLESKMIIFVLTRAMVDYFSIILTNLGPAYSNLDAGKIFALHGTMSQQKRVQVYEKFKNASSGILLCTDLVARGVDIPEVDWIVQYDPPQDPSYFIHRVGRTARMGKEGQSLVFLSKNEDTYVEFLKVKRVPVSEMKIDVSIQKNLFFEDLKKLSLEDRDVLDRAVKAFVSFVSGYKEHHCNYIFQWAKQNYGNIARGLGILFFPKMPDLQRFKIDFENSDVDKDSISYKDKQREKQRLSNLAASKLKQEQDKKDRQLKWKEGQKAKEKATKLRVKRKKSKTQDLRAEWEQLAEETRKIKRVKSKKQKDQTLSEEEQELLSDHNNSED